MTNGPPPGIERMPPQATDIERAVLGAMLLDLEAVKKARVMLSSQAFYERRNAIVFEAICDAYEFEGEADQLIVGDYLKGSGQLDEVGGVLYLAELAATTVTSVNLAHHVAIVKRKFAARQGIEQAAGVIERLYDDNGMEPDAILQDHTRNAGQITSGTVTTGITMNTVMDAAQADYKAAHARHLAGIPYAGIDLGMKDVNDKLNGACPEELTVIAARPSIGKTTLAWQWGLHVAHDHRVAGISLEMSRRQVGGLLLRLQANLRPDGLRKGNLSDDGVGRLGVADTALRGMPITLIDEVPMSIDQVRGAMMNLEAMGHVDLWIIDYLQLITNDASDSELDVITRVLKTLTLELGTHVLLLSQLNRDCERRQDKRPSLADLRGSGGIEQNANNVVLVHRPGFYPELLREARRRAKENGKDEGEAAQKLQEHVTLIFTKTRNGPTGETNGIKWNPERARFEEGLDHGRHF